MTTVRSGVRIVVCKKGRKSDKHRCMVVKGWNVVMGWMIESSTTTRHVCERKVKQKKISMSTIDRVRREQIEIRVEETVIERERKLKDRTNTTKHVSYLKKQVKRTKRGSRSKEENEREREVKIREWTVIGGNAKFANRTNKTERADEWWWSPGEKQSQAKKKTKKTNKKMKRKWW